MSVARLAAVLLTLGLMLTACGPSAAELASVDYTPVTEDVWPVSTPEAQGLDADLVAELFYDAARLETAYSLLVFKNGYLVAEDYFGIGRPDLQVNVHSVTKSITSALVGIAFEHGCLTSLDQRLMEFFPEFENRITDRRKNDITIRQMLQMRAGLPWEESSAEGTEWLLHGFRESDLVGVPIVYDPGTDSAYSNFTAHLLGIVVARACGTDLRTFAQQHLFDPLGITPGFWQVDWDGNYLGFSDVDLSSTDLATFGLMYLDEGRRDGAQVVPPDWVEASLQTYSEGTWTVRVGRNWGDNAYGYQWWSIKAGNHRYSLAWGHGGQQIALVEPLDLMIVFLADPLHLQHGDGPWKIEKANLNLVADFVASLP